MDLNEIEQYDENDYISDAEVEYINYLADSVIDLYKVSDLRYVMDMFGTFSFAQSYSSALESDIHDDGMDLAELTMYNTFFSLMYNEINTFTSLNFDKTLQQLSDEKIEECKFVCKADHLYVFWNTIQVLRVFPPSFDEKGLIIPYKRGYEISGYIN